MTATTRPGLSSLFAPNSIAIVGASAASGKIGYQLAEALRDFRGSVLLVNPRTDAIAGGICYPNLSTLPETPDLVLLAVPADACIPVLAEATELGVGAAIVFAGGFAESGHAGRQLQSRITKLCGDSGLRLLGPNTSGFTQPGNSCHACFVPTVRDLSGGSLSIVAQSGGVNLTLAFLAQQQGIGIRYAVGLGNAADVDAADVIDFLAMDVGTRVIALHLEGVARGRKLFNAIAAATRHKPVIAFPVGRSAVGEFARSHTGNLMTAHATTSAAMRQAGAIVVDTTRSLIDCATGFVHGRLRPLEQAGVAIVTAQAGPGLIILDALRAREVHVPALSDSVVQDITTRLPSLTFVRNPVDTGRPSPAFPDVVISAARDPAVDLLLAFALDEPAAFNAPDALARVRAATEKPLVFGTLGSGSSMGERLERLRSTGIPILQSPEAAANAAWALVEDSRSRYRIETEPRMADQAGREDMTSHVRDEAAAKKLLAQFGIRSPRSQRCTSHLEAHSALANFGVPVAVKILAPTLRHKTDVDGVHLDVRTIEQLRAALARIDSIDIGIDAPAYLVEEMAPEGVDLILGAKRDPSFGATVLVGVGGVCAEAINDVSIRLAPVSRLDAREMLGELRGRAMLGGWRGLPAVGESVLIAAIQAMSELITTRTDLSEVEVNPIRCGPDWALALDALAIRQDGELAGEGETTPGGLVVAQR